MESVSSYTSVLIDRFAGKGILIDTNLLLLYVIGQFDPTILTREAFDRLAAYSLEDFRLLRNLIALFRSRVTTPHVLAEVSNWIGYLPRNQEIECLRRFFEFLNTFGELRMDSFAIGQNAVFPFLGLTDAALASVSQDYLVVTDDARFVYHLNQMGRQALNINHLRQEIWLRDSYLPA